MGVGGPLPVFNYSLVSGLQLRKVTEPLSEGSGLLCWIHHAVALAALLRVTSSGLLQCGHFR